MENDLRMAIERGELVLHFQPQFELASRTIVGAEALARWNRPGFGLLAPLEFIPVAEEAGLIGAIGEWVFNEALRQVRSWEQRGLPEITIAVNVSALQFHEPAFVERIARALASYGIAPRRVELEVTESIVMRNVEASVRALSQLHDLGVKLAVDDFGTGYSSLSQLRHFSFDKLKIDKSFIDDSRNPKVRKLIHAIIAFARSLGIRTNAEGVETRRQLRLLRALGCDEIQGYISGAPAAADGFEKMLDACRGSS
jgi:EAL domain-containing protein (putative c-di-GMP-specific phosphodiesterase class I)